ncbi:MAG: precorrin-6y C5,15-methyltransferase (decarboxylating) subunit CbiE [Desulfomonile tiedjei]|uniref:Precorrin-6y C5,15-methyltransferase (Decarboxylating) subunit CbiE n=1 Tax=Desulfomonile tiedjei TaxID=2358 RepID=A0A9D6Z3D7_9BACT|nr:precorrin-6y C5,15-methyltransferase (decarboxylating) subunit CbiE [Desulfomonile tiedjei]
MGMQCERIAIVGCGPGSPDYLTPAAEKAVEQADVLVGAKRLLALFSNSSAVRIEVNSGIEETLQRMEETEKEKRIAVLVTGDPGIFSLGRRVIKRFGRENCRVIPGISSVHAAFAAIGVDWADAWIISAHKEDPDSVPPIAHWDKIAILGGRETSLQWIAAHLPADSVEERRVFVCENLTLDDERIIEIRASDLGGLKAASRTVVLIMKKSLIP